MKLTTFDEADQRSPAVVHDPAGKDCRLVGDILARVGDKWSMLVIMTLLDGPLRFNELKRAIRGVSQQMLSRNLRALERDGLLTRTVHAEATVRVEYALSDLGRSLSAPVKALGAWAMASRPAIEASRAHYDAVHDE